MNNLWLTADLHLGHVNIIKFCNRPYGSVDEMNKDIIRRINLVCDEGDTLYVLGDLVMGRREETLPLVAQINCQVKLVPGNHDYCWRGDKRHQKWVEKYEELGDLTIVEDGKLDIEGHQVLISHFPYPDPNAEGDHKGRDFVEYSHEDKGEWLIHGHVHDNWLQFDKMINVGVDVWGMNPVNSKDIAALIDRGVDKIRHVHHLEEKLAKN